MQMPIQKFGPVAIFLHWLIAACILFSVAMGLIVSSVEESDTTTLILAVHKSLGIAIFILACVRLAWRLTHPAPPLPRDIHAFQRLAASATHTLLYVIIFAMPVTGYIAVAARGRETTFFGLFAVPFWAPLDRVLSRNAQTIHEYGQYVLYALLVAHIGAAIYHHFILKDQILERMWPGRWKKMPRPERMA